MKFYLLPLAWMGLIFFFSTDIGSYANTSNFFDSLVRFFFPRFTSRDLFFIHNLIRKLGHVLEYGVLSYLWFIALSQGGESWSLSRGLWALALSVFYALLDEYHQSLVRSRTASLLDVGIDSVGAFAGQVLLFWKKRPAVLPNGRPASGNRCG